MFDKDYTWSFLAISSIIAWLYSYFTNKPHRKALLFGLLFLGTGPLYEFFSIPEYWNPEFITRFSIDTPIKTWMFGLEDFVGSFSFSGICFALFETLQMNDKVNSSRKFPFLCMLLWGLFCLANTVIMYFGFRINGIFSTILGLFIASILFYIVNPYYLKNGLLASLIMGTSYWAFLALVFLPLFPDSFHSIWNEKGNSGFFLIGVPVEEFLWAASSALFAGPMYRVAFFKHI